MRREIRMGIVVNSNFSVTQLLPICLEVFHRNHKFFPNVKYLKFKGVSIFNIISLTKNIFVDICLLESEFLPLVHILIKVLLPEVPWAETAYQTLERATPHH